MVTEFILPLYYGSHHFCPSQKRKDRWVKASTENYTKEQIKNGVFPVIIDETSIISGTFQGSSDDMSVFYTHLNGAVIRDAVLDLKSTASGDSYSPQPTDEKILTLIGHGTPRYIGDGFNAAKLVMLFTKFLLIHPKITCINLYGCHTAKTEKIPGTDGMDQNLARDVTILLSSREELRGRPGIRLTGCPGEITFKRGIPINASSKHSHSSSFTTFTINFLPGIGQCAQEENLSEVTPPPIMPVPEIETQEQAYTKSSTRWHSSISCIEYPSSSTKPEETSGTYHQDKLKEKNDEIYGYSACSGGRRGK